MCVCVYAYVCVFVYAYVSVFMCVTPPGAFGLCCRTKLLGERVSSALITIIHTNTRYMSLVTGAY